MPARKIIPTNGNKNPPPQRFTMDDIVRAIDGVERAGYLSEAWKFTASGSIRITQMLKGDMLLTQSGQEAAAGGPTASF